ncbi:MAG: aldose 1-epimerase family protein [Chloroflexota bacterium]|nr:aldose 1-epimerase family protein [Chloroflexota bacterium]MDQ5866904.1 aldose 1-epimerase family protein [Chloroflexota bacterium]
MPKLFGSDYPPGELRELVGTMRQVAGIRLLELADGKPRGMRVAEVYTGSGFRFQVFIDRAMDIGYAEHSGRPLAWVHPALGRPEHYEPQGYGWGRTWGGGLVTTCGLTFFGHPEEDAGETLGLHGRIAHIPAEKVRVVEEWRGDDYVLEIEGQVRQVSLGGENLLLTRKISTRLGADSLTIEDTVLNDDLRPSPHMLLYHCNFGFPVVSPHSEILTNDESVRPRDARAERGFDTHDRFEAPAGPDYDEQVFFHKPHVDAQGYSQAAIVNHRLGFGGYVRYRAAELPFFAHWKQLSSGEYVCALEPATYWETPRHKLREEGRLRFLQPDEHVNYQLELGTLDGPNSIRAFQRQLEG